MNSFGADSHNHLASWAQRELEKWYLPALSLLQRAPPDSFSSGTLSKTRKSSIKLLLLYWVLVALTEHAGPPEAETWLPHSPPTLPGVQCY